MSRRFPAPFRSFACKLASLLMISSAAAAESPWAQFLLSTELWGSEYLGKAPVALDAPVGSMKFDPDGNYLYAGGSSVFRIEWPSKKMVPVWQPSKDDGMQQHASFSPDAKIFARLVQGSEIFIHETATGKLLQRFGEGKRAPGSTATAWSPDGELIAYGGTGEILIHRSRSGALYRQIPQGTIDINALAWSPDGKWLAAANRDEAGKQATAFLHSLVGDIPPVALPGYPNMKLSFTPDSRILAVCDADGELYYWDLAAGRVSYQQRGYDYTFAAHSPDGRYFATGGLNNLEVLDARTGKEVFRHRDESVNSRVGRGTFSPDSSVLAYSVDDRIKFRDTRTWAEIDPDEILRTPVMAAAFSDDGLHLVTGGMNGDLVLWDWEKKTPVWVVKAAPDSWEIRALSISPDKRWIGVAQNPLHPQTSGVSVVDFATGKERTYVPDASGYAAPFFRKDRGTAWVGSRGGNLIEWDPGSKRTLRRVPIPSLGKEHPSITALEADPVERGLIRWKAEYGFGRIDPETGRESLQRDMNKAQPLHAEPMPSRGHDSVLVGSAVLSVPELVQIELRGEGGSPSVKHPSGLLAFTVTGNWRQGVTVFDLLSQAEVQRIVPGLGEIKTLAISPDGKTLVIGSTGGLQYRSLVSNQAFPMILPRLDIWHVPVLDVEPINLEKLRLASKQPEMRPAPPPADEVLWQLMGSSAEWEAYRAAWTLGSRPDCTAFLAAKLSPAGEVPPELKSMLEGMLKDANAEVRQTAARHWLDMGLPLDKPTYESLGEGKLPVAMPPAFELVEPFLTGDSRWDQIKPIPPLTPLSAHKRMMRAVMILGDDRGEESRQLLEKLAGGRESAPLTMAAKRALVRRGAR